MTKKGREMEVITQTNDIQRQMMNEKGGQHKGKKVPCDAEPGGQDKSSEIPFAVYHKIYNIQDNMDRKCKQIRQVNSPLARTEACSM